MMPRLLGLFRTRSRPDGARWDVIAWRADLVPEGRRWRLAAIEDTRPVLEDEHLTRLPATVLAIYLRIRYFGHPVSFKARRHVERKTFAMGGFVRRTNDTGRDERVEALTDLGYFGGGRDLGGDRG